MNLTNFDWRTFILALIIFGPVGWYFLSWLFPTTKDPLIDDLFDGRTLKFALHEADKEGNPIFAGTLLELEGYIMDNLPDHHMDIILSAGHSGCLTHNGRTTHHIIGIKKD